ncbi:MAG TPA: right-handed parallel beta-helix repeat-containing protein, partial [Chryseosolibacter sp.]|nr:right-handed parallel beta-helix repeat-containing protein [Chryseosolibacter sp.]
LVNASDDLHDVTIRDLVIEGSNRAEPPSDPNSNRSYRNPGTRGGIMLLGKTEGQMKNIALVNLTVQNCTYNGVFISGAQHVRITNCDFNENGSSVVPGPRLQHNLLVTHSSDITVEDCRLDTSPFGSGVALTASKDARVTRCEIARNAFYGVLVSECDNVSVAGNFLEGNDHTGIMVEFLYRGSSRVSIDHNVIQYNNGYAVEARAATKCNVAGNTYIANKSGEEKISSAKTIIME